MPVKEAIIPGALLITASCTIQRLDAANREAGDLGCGVGYYK